MNVRAVLTYIGAIFANLILNCIVFPHVVPYGLLPDSVVALTVAIAIVSGSLAGGVYGLVVGLILDILFSRYLGLYALGYMLIGLLAGLFARQYYAQNLVFPPIVAFLLCLLKEGLIALQLRIAGTTFVVGTAFWRYLLPSAVLTGLLTIPLYYFYRRSHRTDLRRSRWDRYSPWPGQRE